MIGALCGWFLSGIFGERAIDRTIAMSWGDGRYGKQFYGAQVYVVPQGSEYSVRARILIGPGNGYYHDGEEIGRAATIQESIDRFGKIHGEGQGLTIGDLAEGFHLPRVHLESQRRVRLCVRTNESVVQPGTSPSFAIPPELPLKGAERPSGWSLVGDQRLAGQVTCQMIDFREVSLGEASWKQPLRLLVRLRAGGGLLEIGGQEAVLAGDSFAAAREVQPRWVGDELHLLTVYTRTADMLFANHVLVQQSNGE
jgi:hypothetical protein